MTLKELRQKAGELAAQVKELASRQDAWTDEDRSKWAAINADYDANAAAIEAESKRLEQSQAVQDRLAEIEQQIRASRTEAAIVDGEQRRQQNPEHVMRDAEETRAMALQGWLRRQNGLGVTERHVQAARECRMSIDSPQLDFNLRHTYGDPAWSVSGRNEVRNLNVGTPSAGGFTVPEGFVNNLERKLLAYGGPRNVATVIRTAAGNDLPWPTVDDTSNTGELLGEGASMGSSVDPTFGTVVLYAYKYSSKPVLISSELLEDSAFNMAALIGDMLGERLGRITGAQFTTGTNAAQPNGIVTASALGKTAASATAITSDELVDLMHSVDPAYRSMATGWMMHDGILQYIRKLKTGTGEYLWQPGLQNGIPDRLLGFPITINQHMQSTVATGTKTVLFGDFSKYIVRDVAAMRMYRLEELYRANDRTGFVVFTRHDGECIQTAAIKHMLQA